MTRTHPAFLILAAALMLITAAVSKSPIFNTNLPVIDSALMDTTVPTDTPTPGDTSTPMPAPTDTPSPPDPSATPVVIFTPYPDAPLCPDTATAHNNSLFHTLWDSARGCHYNHEHGQNPFTPSVDAVFPGIQSFLCGVQIGSCNPSSPAENTTKHGGHKWHVQLQLPQPCVPFESATVGANAAVVEYHTFGDEAIELESRTHSAVIFVRQCKTTNPSDTGLVYAGTLQDYGQRIIPYQGTVMGYPNQPIPAYNSSAGPYLSTDCVNGGVIQCRSSLAFAVSHNVPVNSIWTSKPTYPNRAGSFGTRVFQLLFRLRDGYRLFDWNDQTYPFTFLWMCSSDGGSTYNPAGCHWNNSTTQAQEITGIVPVTWDNLAGFDINPAVGRITANGFTDSAGNLSGPCLPGGGCYPIHLVNAFVGQWGAVLVCTDGKCGNVVPIEPSRNIFFCAGLPCAETSAGAMPSSWIGNIN